MEFDIVKKISESLVQVNQKKQNNITILLDSIKSIELKVNL